MRYPAEPAPVAHGAPAARVTRLLSALVALCFCLLPLAAGAQEQSSPFTDAERTALHAEIRSYLLAHPEVILEVIQELEKKQQAQAAADDQTLIAANWDAIFADGFSQATGNPDAGLTVVEFLDYQCGYCRRAFPEVAKLIGQDGDIRLIVKELPILGPGSELAARAAIATQIASGSEAYFALHDRLMAMKGEIDEARLDALLSELGEDPEAIRAGMHSAEVDRRLSETRALAETLGISGTPTFVVGDQMLRGYLPPEAMAGLVAEIRAGG